MALYKVTFSHDIPNPNGKGTVENSGHVLVEGASPDEVKQPIIDTIKSILDKKHHKTIKVEATEQQPESEA